MKCVKGLEVQVLKSAAGHYIGTVEYGMPYCRLSIDYYNTKEEAQEALDTHSYIERRSAEVEFCNGNSRVCVTAD